MVSQIAKWFQGGWTLLRLIAVISSSIATLISSFLPLFLHISYSSNNLYFLFIFLSIGAVTVHGVLTHSFNDYADFQSGTDAHSPAILSGGSRVIQKGMISSRRLWQLGKWLAIILLGFAVLMAIMSQYKITILIIIGVWAAASYSLPPLRLSYRPFVGEWFSLFPAILFLGLAGPWLVLGHMPVWAVQNAVINALICMAWVMVHHIPDLEADRQATPVKQNTVVWFADAFGLSYARVPALLYLFMAGLCTIWLGFNRLWAGLFLILIISIGLYFMMKMDVTDIQQVTNYEKFLLLLAIVTAVILGIV